MSVMLCISSSCGNVPLLYYMSKRESPSCARRAGDDRALELIGDPTPERAVRVRLRDRNARASPAASRAPGQYATSSPGSAATPAISRLFVGPRHVPG